MEKKMEATIMENERDKKMGNEMETMLILCCIRVILGLYRDNGKENGNYYSI